VTYVLAFEECRQGDLGRVGGKCASLGSLLDAGLPVPRGFAVTTDAFTEMLASDALGSRVEERLVGLDPGDLDELATCSERVRALIEAAPVPASVEAAVRDAYESLGAAANLSDVPVAVRSSATAEDLPGASFAGQQDTYLWVVGADAVLTHVRRCWSSLYTARAISYRHVNGFAHDQVLMSVAVQTMVRAKAAGVAMTLNPIDGDRSKIVIDSSFGLGETVAGGLVTPDNFVVDKVMLEVLRRTISAKHVELVADPDRRCTVERPIETERQEEPSLTLDEVKAVARLAKLAEQHYGCPQDVEWALDADGENEIVLLQSRPETVWSKAPQPSKPATYETGLAGVLSTLMNPLATKKNPSQ
jgi:pyruvate,water dikinase